MSRTVRRFVLLGVLLAVAGVCAYAAYGAVARRPPASDPWARAAAAVRDADRIKAQLPALQARDHAIALFRGLATSGPASARSRAEMIVGLLLLGTARTDPGRRQELLADSAESLRQAVRLDRTNDDAAYDLELLLSRAKASHQPIAQVPRRRIGKHHGKPSSGKPGHGY